MTRWRYWQSHGWPVNVRQLRNNVERMMILAGGGTEGIIPPTFCRRTSARLSCYADQQQWRTLMGLPLLEAPGRIRRDTCSGVVPQISLSRNLAHSGMRWMERSAVKTKKLASSRRWV